MPERETPLQLHQQGVGQRAGEGRHHNRAPHQRHLHLGRLGGNAKTQPGCGRTKKLGHDGPDQRQRGVDLERTKNERQGTGQAQPQQGLPVARRIAVHQLALELAGGFQTGQGGHQHGEKGHQHHHRRLGGPVKTKPHHGNRCHPDQRHGAGERGNRQQATLQKRQAVDGHGHRKPQAAAQHPAGEHRLEHGLHKVAPQQRPALAHGLHDLQRRRQQHPGHLIRGDQQLPEVQQPQAEQARRQQPVNGPPVQPGASPHGPHGQPQHAQKYRQEKAARAYGISGGSYKNRSNQHTNRYQAQHRLRAARLHARPPKRRSTSRSTPSTAAVRARPSKADISSADQMATVLP